jgi:outer membrane protein OmpA-like peptidoglycan-associated protein
MMRPRTNRLLMLLVGVAISGCASQTDRSSSGGGDQSRMEKETAAESAAATPPAPEPAAAYEPEREPVQYVDRPLDETPPPKPAATAAAPKDEALPDFPITKYELPEEQAEDDAVGELGPQEDESESAQQDAAPAEESSVGETTEYADDEPADTEEIVTTGEIEELGPVEDESVSEAQDEQPPEESSVGETTENADTEEVVTTGEIEELGPVEDESVSEAQDDAPTAESSVGEPHEYADEQPDPKEIVTTGKVEEVEDLGPVSDESGSVSYPEDKRPVAENVVGEPKIYADEPVPKAAPASPKVVSVNFETEPLFNFDKSAIRGDQGTKLDEFVSSLDGTQYDSIAVTGHADRIGKEAYNQKLSERRANAVKAYLVRKGVPADKIQTEGRGESEPVTGDTCAKTRGKALISCLQPDRRVDVSVSATKKSN